MNKNILKSIFAINAVIFILVIMSCDIFEDFEDETSEMGTADKTAKETLSDAKIKVYTSLLKDWTGKPKFDSTLVISEMLKVNDPLLTAYDTTVFVWDTTIVGTDTTVTPDSFKVDTTYNFVYNNSFHITDTIDFSITTGEDTSFYFDSTIVVTDTISSPSEDSVLYEASIGVTKIFPIDLIRLEFSNSTKDTVSFNENYSKKTRSDLFYLLDEKNLGIKINDNFHTFDTTFSYDTTIFTYDTTISGIDTTVVPDSFEVDTTANIADHLTSYEVKTFSDTTQSYLLFDNVMSGDVIFFFTDYIYMNLYDEDGNVLEIEDSDMPLETVVGFFNVSGKNPCPVIKSRFAYKIDAKKYLIELITYDQTKSKTFNAAIHFDK